MKKLQVGIIGAGRIGNVHARTLVTRIPQAVAAAVTDVNPQAARELADRCGIERVAGSAAEILGDASIGAVLICSSTDTHAGLVVDAARAKLQVGFNRRFDANFARVRAAVATGEIGTPHLMHISGSRFWGARGRLRRGIVIRMRR